MTSQKQQHWIIINISLVCLLLTGCGTTPPSRYYMLNGIPQASIDNRLNQDEVKVHIGVGPITIPKYLDRYAIVKRSNGAEVIINDAHRWAEPLADNFTRVLANNIYLLTDTADISIHPWRNANEIDYQVVIDVQRFDADLNNNVILNVHWTINGKAGKKSLYKQKIIIRDNAGNGDYATLVSAQSKATEKLSREIADKLKEIIAQEN